MWPKPQFTADLVTFTEETLNGNFIFCVVCVMVFTMNKLENIKVSDIMTLHKK